MSWNTIQRWGLIMLAILILGGGLAMGCSSDDDNDSDNALNRNAAETQNTGANDRDGGATESSDADDEDIRDFVTSFIDAYNDGDSEAFFSDITDNGVRGFLGNFGMDIADLNAAKEEAAPFIGEDPIDVGELNVVNSTDNSATVEMIGSSAGILEGDRLELVRVGDDWKVDNLQLFAVSPGIPDGYTSIEMVLTEFSFDPGGQIAPGEVAFNLQNRGQQAHEAILARLDEDVVLDEALQEQEDEPEGIEVIGGVFRIEPGASYNMVLTDELEAGRYAFVCFLPDTSDPAGTPHAYKGMAHEFTIK